MPHKGREGGSAIRPDRKPARVKEAPHPPVAEPPDAAWQARGLVSFWNVGKVKNTFHPLLPLEQEESLIVFTGRLGKGKAIQLNTSRAQGKFGRRSMARMLHPNKIPCPHLDAVDKLRPA